MNWLTTLGDGGYSCIDRCPCAREIDTARAHIQVIKRRWINQSNIMFKDLSMKVWKWFFSLPQKLQCSIQTDILRFNSEYQYSYVRNWNLCAYMRCIVLVGGALVWFRAGIFFRCVNCASSNKAFLDELIKQCVKNVCAPIGSFCWLLSHPIQSKLIFHSSYTFLLATKNRNYCCLATGKNVSVQICRKKSNQIKKIVNTHIDSLIPVQPVLTLFLCVLSQAIAHEVMDCVSMVQVSYPLPGWRGFILMKHTTDCKVEEKKPEKHHIG